MSRFFLAGAGRAGLTGVKPVAIQPPFHAAFYG